MRLLLTLAALVGGLLALGGCQVLNRSSAAEGAQGRLAWPKDGDLWIYHFDSKQQQKITSLPSGAAVTGASWSADGRRLVYSQFWRRPGDRASGADIFVANADGTNAQVFAERDAPNTALEAPQWAPSGNVYYTSRKLTGGRESLQIMRQLENGQPELVIDDAYNVSVAADESFVVYLRNTRVGQTLMKKSLKQPSDDGCELLSDQVFQYLGLPRIAPDGARVAFSGSGEANPQPSGCGGDNRARPSAAAPLLALARLLEPGVAYAHGLPADVYTVRADGSDLQRVADLKDDEPTVAWSPDAARLATWGLTGLAVVDTRGGTPQKLVDQGGYGAIDWTR